MFLREATSQIIRFGPFLDRTDGQTIEGGITVSQADMQLSKDGGTFAQKNGAADAAHDVAGWYYTTLDATDTATCGELYMQVNDAAALPVFSRYWVLPANVYDIFFSSTASIGTDIDALTADLSTANTAASAIQVQTDKLAFTETNQVDSTVKHIADKAITFAGGKFVAT